MADGQCEDREGGRDGAEQPHRPVCAAVLPDPPGAILGGGVGVFALCSSAKISRHGGGAKKWLNFEKNCRGACKILKKRHGQHL